MAKPDPYIGQTVAGRYDVQALLGAGAMGNVYRAVDGEQVVALKIIHPHLLAHANMVDRFKREMAITHELVHDSIVHVHGFGTSSSGELFLAMELLEGETLEEVVRRCGALPFRRTGEIIAQVADALQVAHSANFVHRDVKPENVMVCGEDRRVAKVLDFGISRVIGSFAADKEHEGLEGFRTLTRANKSLGTPTYMSPEQLENEPVGPASDTYSLGVVLYELLAGRPPFKCKTVRQAVHLHLDNEPPPLDQVAPRPVPEWLDRLCREMLAKEPEDRPEPVGEVARRLRERLHELEDGELRDRDPDIDPVPVTEEVPKPARREVIDFSIPSAREIREGRRRRRLLVGAGGIAVVLALLAMLAVALYFLLS